jgi:hypothetical protein
MTNPNLWRPLSPAFQGALRRFDSASNARLRTNEVRNAIASPLFHYTDGPGLKGIITTEQFWFTHYRHLNDDTELKFGMDVAKATISEVGAKSPKVKIFCDMVIDLFSDENMRGTFEFYIASFSRNGDSPHQWKRYAQHGQGFAIGIAPRLFAVENKPNRKPHENVFVAPVCYSDSAGRKHHLPAIESAARIVEETVKRKSQAMLEINTGMPFFDELEKVLIAKELILNSLTLKHQDWTPEQEVRLFIIGQTASLAPYVSTRCRGTDTVPFIKSDMPLRQPGSIIGIVIGSDAPSDAEDFVCTLLRPFYADPRAVIRRSTVRVT